MSNVTFRRMCLAALVGLVAIVITGASVRLTGSGLGCTDWPNCEENQLVPELTLHGWIEFGNRLVSIVLGLVVLVPLVSALRMKPRRADYVMLTSAIMAGVIVQAIIGKISVEQELNPPIVMAHFLASLLLIWWALDLYHRTGWPDGVRPPRPTSTNNSVGALSKLVVAVGCAVVFTGTIVTAAGPHSGDETAERLDLGLPSAARLHAMTAMGLVLVALVLRWLIGPGRENLPVLRRRVDVLLAVLIAQAGIGYVQYFTGVPALLVIFHIGGAVTVFIAAIEVGMARPGPPGSARAPDTGGEAAEVGAH